MIIRAIRGLSNIKAGRGLSATVGIDGIVLALLGAFKERFLLGKITAAPAPGQLILPSQCRYSARAIGKARVVLTDVLPAYGRQVENDEVGVYPAKVGDLCAILRNPQGGGKVRAELWVFRENPGRGPCPELAPLIGGNGGSSVGGVGGGGGGSEGPPNDPSGPGDPGGGTPIGGGGSGGEID